MLNRISGWLLFCQASYLGLFVVLALTDVITRGAVFLVFTHLRTALQLENTYIRLSDFIYHPMVLSAPLNVALLIAFFWRVLRRQHAPSLSSDFFSIINVVYIAASGWILIAAFTNYLHR